MNRKSLVALALCGWFVAFALGCYILFTGKAVVPEISTLATPGPDTLVDRPLTFTEVEQSAIDKWRMQGFENALKMHGPDDIAGKPGCVEYDYYLSNHYKVGAAMGHIIVCGKDVQISNAQIALVK